MLFAIKYTFALVGRNAYRAWLVLLSLGILAMERMCADMLSSQELASMRCADIEHCVLPDLIDISNLQVNHNLSVNERITQFISDVGNPYLFRVDDIAVKVEYSDQNVSLQERLTRLMRE